MAIQQEGYFYDDDTSYQYDAPETSWWDNLTSGIGTLGDSVWDYVTDVDEGLLGDALSLVTKKDGSIDWGSIAAIGGGVAGALGLFSPDQQKTGYQGGIPSYTATREQVPTLSPTAAAEAKEYVGGIGYKPTQAQLSEFTSQLPAGSAQPYQYDPNRRPGSSGRRYFTDVQYSAPDQAASARTGAQERALGLAALNAGNPAVQSRPAALPSRKKPVEPTVKRPASDVIKDLPIEEQKLARGGLASLNGKGYYLGGVTDGMADQVPAQIDRQQPAALSDGEFVVPADVVSHLGNGNSNAGAKQLYGMMDRVRQERTGTKQQGKQINPNKFVPA
jgi:hypothetical protein